MSTWPYSVPRERAEALRDAGLLAGHKVMITEVGPRHVLDCTCGDPWGCRFADPLPAVEAALTHLEEVIGGELTAAGAPGGHDGRHVRNPMEAIHRG